MHIENSRNRLRKQWTPGGRYGSASVPKAQAKRAGALLAQLVGHQQGADFTTALDARARGVLARAFGQLVLRKGRPFVMQISEGEYLAFPGGEALSGGRYALAVGCDAAGFPSYAVQGAAPADQTAPAAVIAAAAERAALARLRGLLQTPGFRAGWA